MLFAASLITCGGGDDDTGREKQQITAAIGQVATSDDPAICTERQTQRFVEQVVGEASPARQRSRPASATPAAGSPQTRR